ncbi:SDR family oxidoreductase [Brevibacterium sp. RIT 803]|uniref:SDR family oxidoreductase n=1 Tax=Brevibacterium sp. RIT 803 TaxID=2810210 RepID=UPI0019509FFE|nr:SDR family oxidoreductase [Brevibacterium sp. RIT 803]MBM6589203.1 SDR family oxidoreductase [Brevibacterium sp. RIT 803]
MAQSHPETIVPSPHPRTVLVLGATGYIGGRLVPRLLQAGHHVRVAVRSPQKLEQVPWVDQVDVHRVDLDDGDGLVEAATGVEVIHHLVHSMGSGQDFEQKEAATARRVAEAAEAAGVRRIVYLGGLHPDKADLSMHMRSRAQVGRILIDSQVPTIAFQAGIIIGSGSASFEMVRHLAMTLRLMPAPRWVTNRVEPLAVRDVLYYLLSAVDVDDDVNRAFDIGSHDVLEYAEIMKTFAGIAGLKPRHVLALPLPAPTLSGIWVGLVTPLPFTLTLPLVQSLQEDAVTADRDVDEVIPPPPEGLLNFEQSVRLALLREAEGAVDTNWDADTGGLAQAAKPLPNDPEWAGERVFTDDRTLHFPDLTPEQLWPVVEGIGGKNGWYSWPLAWRVRGVWDKIVGGAGLNRGRRLPDRLRVGDPVDWWRVEELEPGHRLLLRAEMRVSGRAWLEFTTSRAGRGSDLRQRAIFIPRGIRGQLYWGFVSPFHRFIFPAMAKNIARAAKKSR